MLSLPLYPGLMAAKQHYVSGAARVVLDDDARPDRLVQRGDVGRLAIEMHGDAGLGARRDCCSHLHSIDEERVGIYVDKNDRCANLFHDIGGREARHCLYDHLIPRPDIETRAPPRVQLEVSLEWATRK